MADTTRVVRIVVDAGGARQGAVQVTDSLERIDRQRVRTQSGMQQLAAAQVRGAGSSRQFGNAVQQAGFQVGDFAVQVASGSGVLRPFIQQGTQLISMFGPWGAVIGAAGAVVGALAVAFLGASDAAAEMDAAAEAAETTSAALTRTMGENAKGAEDLAKKYRELGAEMRAVEEIALLSAQRRIGEEQDALRVGTDAALSQLSALAETLNQPRVALDATPLSAADQARFDSLTQVAEALEKFQQGGSIAALAVDLGAVAKASAGAGDALAGQLETLVDSAKRSDELATQQERVAAMQRLLAGTATDADRALLDMASGADSASKKVRTFADVLADLNETALKNAGKEYADSIKLIEKTVESGLTDQEKYARQVDALDRALEAAAKGGYQLSIDAQNALNRAMREADPAAQKAKEAAEKASKERERLAEQEAKLLAKPFENALEGIQKGFSDFFVDVFDGGIDSFRDLASGIKSIFVRLAAELAALMVIRPVLAGVGLGGLVGVGGAGSAFAGTGGGFGGGLSGIGGDLFGIGRQLAGGTGSLGAYLFGGAPVYGNVGAAGMRGIASGVTPGLFGTGSSFLAESFLPVIGSVLPGLIGGNYAQAGLGGLGALGGTLIGGPIGGAIGGVLGNLLGGLFGGKKKTPQAVTNITGGSGFGVGGNVIRAGGNVGATSSLAEDIAAAANGIVEALGGQLKNAIGGYILTSTGKNQGTVFLGGTGQYGKGGSTLSDVFGSSFADSIKGDASAVAQATTIAILKANAASGRISGLSGTESTILRNTGARDLAALNEDLSFGELYNQLIGVTKETTQAEQAIDALNKQFADARKQAAALGLNVGKLTQAQVKAIQQLTTDFNTGIQDQILGLTNPTALAMRELEREQATRLANAKKLGADLVEVERLNALERKAVVEQTLGGLMALRDDLTFGAGAGATPAASLSGVRAAFEAAAAQGDVAGIQRYGGALAGLSRDVNASTGAFYADRDRVLEVIGRQLNPPSNNNMAAANQTAASSTETAATVKSLLAVNQEQLRTNMALTQEVTALRAATQRQAAEAAEANAQMKRLVNARPRDQRGGEGGRGRR